MVFFEKEIKPFGFGLMRLPRKGEEIDIEQVKVMVDRFLDAGFTYFDTAWAYPGSEDAIRQALVERYPRESFQLATKNAAWMKCETREDAVRQFEESLERTGAGYFDNYLLHNLGEMRTHFFVLFQIIIVIADVVNKIPAFQIQNSGGDPVDKVPVMADAENGAGILPQRILKDFAGDRIQVVGRLVQKKEICL